MVDWIYASTDAVHCSCSACRPNGAFRHSREFRTVFAADELLHVLEGTLVIAEPGDRRGAAHRTGESVFFRSDTWHHAFALGPRAAARARALRAAAGRRRVERLRPHAAVPGDSRATPTTRCSAAGRPGCRATADAACRARRPTSCGGATSACCVGLACSTEHLTAGTLEVGPGEAAAPHAHGGDEVLYVARRACCTSAPGTTTRRACSSSSPRTPATCRPARGTSTATTAPRRRARCSASRRDYAVTWSLGLDVGGDEDRGRQRRRRRRGEVSRAPELADRGRERAARRGAGRRRALRRGARRRTGVGIGVCELVDPAGRTTSAETIDWRDRSCPTRSGAVLGRVRRARGGAGRGALRRRPRPLGLPLRDDLDRDQPLPRDRRPAAAGRARQRDRHRRAAGRAWRRAAALQDAAGRASAQDGAGGSRCAPLVEERGRRAGRGARRARQRARPRGGRHRRRPRPGARLPRACGSRRCAAGSIARRHAASLAIVEAELGADAGVVGAALAGAG